MKKHVQLGLLIFLFTGIWCACSDDNGGGDIPSSAPEVALQNLNLKNAILPGKSIRLRANIINETVADLQWFVNGEKRATTSTFEFSSQQEGSFLIQVTASNALGSASDTLRVNVIDGFQFDDITNWTGTGDNRAALAIQWLKPGANNILHPKEEEIFFRAWGYRWESTATPSGYDMIQAIAQKDPHLFIIISPNQSMEVIIKGFIYDGNGDGHISLKSNDTPEHGNLTGIHLTETDFAQGIYTHQDSENIDDFQVLSEGDYWIGGWHKAYTTYWIGAGEAVLDANEYTYSNFSAPKRMLENDCWDVWTFSSVNNAAENTLPVPHLLKAAQ